MNLIKSPMNTEQIVRWWPEAERVLARRSEETYADRVAERELVARFLLSQRAKSFGSTVDPKLRDLTPKEWR